LALWALSFFEINLPRDVARAPHENLLFFAMIESTQLRCSGGSLCYYSFFDWLPSNKLATLASRLIYGTPDRLSLAYLTTEVSAG